MRRQTERANTLTARLRRIGHPIARKAGRATPDAEPLLHPALVTIYRDKVERLEASLRQPDTGREAFELIRGLIDAITPVDGKLEIELRGDMAGILVVSQAGKAATSSKEKALQIKMVAYRTRFHFERDARK